MCCKVVTIVKGNYIHTCSPVFYLQLYGRRVVLYSCDRFKTRSACVLILYITYMRKSVNVKKSVSKCCENTKVSHQSIIVEGNLNLRHLQNGLNESESVASVRK